MRKILAVVLVFILMCGCESTGRVHDKYYLRAASVSSAEPMTVTFSFFFGDEEAITVRGDSLESALENAEVYAGKPVFTGFTELVVTDGENSREVLEYMLKEWNISPSCMVAYNEDGSNLLENVSAERLLDSMKESAELERIPESKMIKVLGQLIRNGETQVGILTENGAYGEMIIK